MAEPAQDRQEALFRHQGCDRGAPLRCEEAGSLSRRTHRRISRRRWKCASSRAGNPTRPISSITPNRKYVLRRKPPGKLLPSAHAVDREFKVISALHPTGFPVAKPYLLCEDDSIIGTMFYVMDCVEGRIYWDGHCCRAWTPKRTQRDLRRDERNARAPAQHRLRRNRAFRNSASRAITSRARFRAGPSNINCPRPRTSTR